MIDRLNNPQLLSYAIVTKNVENLTCVFGLLRPLVYDVYSMQINRGRIILHERGVLCRKVVLWQSSKKG